MSVMREMPVYVCHKEVWALKIKAIRDGSYNQVSLSFEEDGYGPITVEWDWYYKHKPTSGGYYVVYKDGYRSFSPAVPFEEGYALKSTLQQAAGDDARDQKYDFILAMCREAQMHASRAQEDAARYRWLRGPDQESTRYSRWRIEYWDGPNGWQPVQRESMDVAVNAAMSTQRPGDGHE